MTSTTTSMLTRSLSGRFNGRLNEQLQYQMEQPELDSAAGMAADKDDGSHIQTPLRSAGRTRSLSDAPKPSPPTQPASRVPHQCTSKDDSSIWAPIPETPQRQSSSSSSSQLPAKVPETMSSMANRPAISPKVDLSGSPASVLPRRSRGLDFSRACTNLHHSTLAESSPDSSPLVAGRGVSIPRRRRSHSSGSALALSNSGQADRTAISSSVSSVNMMESDTSSSEEEEDVSMIGDRDDMMITNTPQPNRFGGGSNTFAGSNIPSPGNDWMGGFSQVAPSLMSFQRARLGKNRSRHSSSSGSGNSAKPSPGPLSPPVMKSIENTSGGYFGFKNNTQQPRTDCANEMRFSDISDDGENRTGRSNSPAGAAASKREGAPLGVVRRAVNRRGSLLPKSKNFARIRAALFEEAAPIDSEAKRESEVIRQVRESEPTISQKGQALDAHPSLNQPAGPGTEADIENSSAKSEATVLSQHSFNNQAIRNSAGLEFWDTFDGRYRTPPPQSRHRGPSMVSEEDMSMDTTPSAAADNSKTWERPPSQSSSLAFHTSQGLKRRREDDLDPSVLKRRAVSPSMSTQSSPVFPQSPAVKQNNGGNNVWGPPKVSIGPLFPERHGSHDSGGRPGTSKRVGLQGMSEANDGFMNMSIE